MGGRGDRREVMGACASFPQSDAPNFPPLFHDLNTCFQKKGHLLGRFAVNRRHSAFLLQARPAELCYYRALERLEEKLIP
jgi:hypothetical protein